MLMELTVTDGTTKEPATKTERESVEVLRQTSTATPFIINS